MHTRPHSPSQSPRRREQRRLRMRAIALGRWAARSGWSSSQTAECLGVDLRALQRWQRSWAHRSLRLTPTGRPRRLADPLVRQLVLEALEHLGPQTGLPSLQAMFPGVARHELIALLREFRDRGDQEHVPAVLRWPVPGAVWACDFTDPDMPVDGCYPYLLIVRDLASHQQLLTLPARHATAEVAAAALEALFRAWGAPLVLKFDNGGHFTAPLVQSLLADWGVIALPSPPCCPQYNGAIEAGAGSVKFRIHYLAAARGRPGSWSSDDVEAGRLQANATLRPWGTRGTTPGQAWLARPPISDDQRRAFQDCVRRSQEQVRVARGYPPADALDERQRAALARAAVRRALEELGYLQVQRRRNTPPINP